MLIDIKINLPSLLMSDKVDLKTKTVLKAKKKKKALHNNKGFNPREYSICKYCIYA